MTFALEAANEPNTPWNFSNFCLKTTIRVISYSLESLCGVFRVFSLSKFHKNITFISALRSTLKILMRLKDISMEFGIYLFK